jgi:hypothetical protein
MNVEKLTIFQNSYFRSCCVLRGSGNGKRYLRNNLASIFFTQEQRLTEPPFHLLNRTNRRVLLPAGRRGYLAEPVNIERHISAITRMLLIGQESPAGVLEQVFAIYGFACRISASPWNMGRKVVVVTPTGDGKCPGRLS